MVIVRQLSSTLTSLLTLFSSVLHLDVNHPQYNTQEYVGWWEGNTRVNILGCSREN